MNTTLRAILAHEPCNQNGPADAGGWQKLLAHLGKTEADDEPLPLRTILESNGVEDAIWALRSVEGHDREIRLFAADCAERVLPIYEEKYPGDDRPRRAIEAARKFANGLIGADELSAAGDAAWAAARAAAGAAAGAAEREWQRESLLKII